MMGLFRWRRITEKTKQAIGLHGNDFQPTSNARNDAMISETRRFAVHIKALHRDFLSLTKGIDGELAYLEGTQHTPDTAVMMVTTRGVLAASLPRIFDIGRDSAVPVPEEGSVVGEGVDATAIVDANMELKEKMQQEVLYPLEQWLAAYRTIKARNARNEKSRFELDSRRREKALLEEKHERAHEAHEKLSEAKQGPNLRKLEQLDFKYTTSVDQVARLTTRYIEVEGEVYNALLSLIGDTLVLKRYAAVALFLYRKCFASSYAAFDFSTPRYPIPALDAEAGLSSADAFAPSQDVTSPQSDPLTTPAKVGLEQKFSNPGTPDQSQESMPAFASKLEPATSQRAPLPPAWYTEARTQAGTEAGVTYESDEEEGPIEDGNVNPFAEAESPISE